VLAREDTEDLVADLGVVEPQVLELRPFAFATL
jgi:hypothetical protein